MSVGLSHQDCSTSSTERSSDYVGIACSLFCLLHCWSVPVLLALAPSLSSIRFLTNPLFHQIAFVTAFVVAIAAILPEVRRHRNGVVFGLLVSGLSLLFVGAFVIPDDCCPSGSVPATSPIYSENIYSKSIVPVALFGSDPLVAEVQSASSPMQLASSQPNFAGTFGMLFTDDQIADMMQLAIVARPYVTPLGGVLLVLAHMLNLWLRVTRRDTETVCC